jgi:hypothetical protein
VREHLPRQEIESSNRRSIGRSFLLGDHGGVDNAPRSGTPGAGGTLRERMARERPGMLQVADEEGFR